MSHPQQIEFVTIAKSLFPEMFSRRRVLEVGSLDINGTIRGLFSECEYVGLDVAPGPSVDVVCQGQDYDAPDGSFEVAISCEVMEHNPQWAATIENMLRVLKPGGLVIMSCATHWRPEHGTSQSSPESSPLTVKQGWEYYRNLSARDILREVSFESLSCWGFATNWESWDLYFLGKKSGGDDSPELTMRRIAEFRAIYRRRVAPTMVRRALRMLRSPSRVLAFMKRKTGTGR